MDLSPDTSCFLDGTRRDGWTPALKARFLAILAESGNVRLAARRCGLSAQSAYVQRRRDARFARAWAAALRLARDHCEQVLHDRAIEGIEEPVWYHGELVGTRRRYDTRLLLAHMARLDRLGDDERVEADAGRFDEMLALIAGETLPEPLIRGADFLPRDRRQHGRAALQAAEQALAVEGGKVDADSRELARLYAVRDARREWDAWRDRAHARADEVLDDLVPQDRVNLSTSVPGQSDPLHLWGGGRREAADAGGSRSARPLHRLREAQFILSGRPAGQPKVRSPSPLPGRISVEGSTPIPAIAFPALGQSFVDQRAAQAFTASGDVAEQAVGPVAIPAEGLAFQRERAGVEQGLQPVGRLFAEPGLMGAARFRHFGGVDVGDADLVAAVPEGVTVDDAVELLRSGAAGEAGALAVGRDGCAETEREAGRAAAPQEQRGDGRKRSREPDRRKPAAPGFPASRAAEGGGLEWTGLPACHGRDHAGALANIRCTVRSTLQR